MNLSSERPRKNSPFPFTFLLPPAKLLHDDSESLKLSPFRVKFPRQHDNLIINFPTGPEEYEVFAADAPYFFKPFARIRKCESEQRCPS